MEVESVSLISSENSEVVLELVDGQITLGRGPLLGIAEAKVSRSHAVLRVSQSNQVEVKPLSKNPLFYYEKISGSNTSKRRAIPKDVFFALNDDDQISFLPDSLRFQLKIRRKISPSTSLQQTLDDPLEIDAPPTPEQLLEVKETLEAPIDEISSGSELSPAKHINSSLPDDTATSTCNHEAATSPRKRKLPDWMSKNGASCNKLANVTPQQKDSSNSRVNGCKKFSKFESTVLSGNDHSDSLDDSLLANLSPVIAVDPIVNTTPVIAVDRLSLNQAEVSVPDNSEVFSGGISGPQNLNDHQGSTNNRRQKCSYGGKCYRKNPAHRRELAHPGDSDFSSSETPDEPSSVLSVTPATPICPYGTKCYRKNAAHKANFRHDIDPAEQDSNASRGEITPRKRTVRSEQASADEYDGTYDYEDSFINDASDFDDDESSEEDNSEDEDFDVEDLASTSRAGRERARRKNEAEKKGCSKTGSNSRRNRVDSTDEEESDEEDLSQLIRESNSFIRRENRKTSKK